MLASRILGAPAVWCQHIVELCINQTPAWLPEQAQRMPRGKNKTVQDAASFASSKGISHHGLCPPLLTLPCQEAGKFGMVMAFLLLVAQETRQNDGSSASHKAFLPSPSPKTQAQGVKIRMNTAPRCIATTKTPSKPRKKPHTGKTKSCFYRAGGWEPPTYLSL